MIFDFAIEGLYTVLYSAVNSTGLAKHSVQCIYLYICGDIIQYCPVVNRS